jgi:hypothetical protein
LFGRQLRQAETSCDPTDTIGFIIGGKWTVI